MIKIGRFYRERIIDGLNKSRQSSEAMFFINFKGINSGNLNILRSSLKDKQAKLLVSRNRLMKLVFSNIKGDINSFLTAETGIVYSMPDALVDTAKILFNFKKENEAFQIKGGIINEKIVGAQELESISNLPSRAALLSMTVNCIAAPLIFTVNTLSQIILKFVWAVEEIKKKKNRHPTE